MQNPQNNVILEYDIANLLIVFINFLQNNQTQK